MSIGEAHSTPVDESRPVVERVAGSTGIIAGTLNGPSLLLIKVTHLAGDSNTIYHMARMVDDACA
ncbi:hypothetical protein C8Q74DRAFT_1300215 [Fomes fomentarius]|nr:hypothetical protein C8Q74DRAFT_1300215 [Fomes fomentarius]